MTKPTHITVPVTTQEPKALFLRQVIGEANMPDGRPVKLSLSGATVIIEVGDFDDPARVCQTLKLDDLGEAWMRAIDTEPVTAEQIARKVIGEDQLAGVGYQHDYDVALRDFGLMLGALTLTRLAWAYDPAGLRR